MKRSSLSPGTSDNTFVWPANSTQLSTRSTVSERDDGRTTHSLPKAETCDFVMMWVFPTNTSRFGACQCSICGKTPFFSGKTAKSFSPSRPSAYITGMAENECVSEETDCATRMTCSEPNGANVL
ncbi:unnamed protein product [Haemonchus placei]|uniref:Uncharacterized protein n=1 Tax=Haemonchus placei TaxID=6290 RepID=A0A0N4WJW2_HAEPC|nr:unnamed protein product [Haemonchus placei]